MRALGIFNRQSTSRLAAIGVLLLATVVQAAMPMLVAADQVTERSIALSSSSKSATNVTYTLDFTVANDAGAFVLDFCSDSPIVGQACTPPTGFTAASANTATAGFTVTPGTSKIVVDGTLDKDTAGGKITVDITGITNPSTVDPLYARLVTYDTPENADLYTAEDLGDGAQDTGGVAIAITDTVGVSGAVLESMTFCVAKNAITKDCDLTGNEAPTLKLGEPVAGTTTVALDAAHVSTGDLYTQISTNALNGAVVWLKSGTDCGGLKRAETTTCDIVPALTGDISEGEAKFGVKTSAATDSAGVTGSGTYQPANGSSYNASTYVLNYVANKASGVTSVYGDEFLDTDGAPVNNKNMKITFGASVSNDTPAGLYSTDLSLIATGKF